MGLLTSLLCFAALVLLTPPLAAADSGAGEVPPCPGELSQPFAAWGDDDFYRLAPGGDFEGAMDGWLHGDGVGTVPGSSPLGGGSVLAIGPGGAATSAPICIDGSETFSRMFVRGVGAHGLDGDEGGRLLVEVVAPDGSSKLARSLRADEGWDLSKRFDVPAEWTRDGITSFQYRFTARRGAAALIDGLNVDPRARH